jgi:hypothetical protein
MSVLRLLVDRNKKAVVIDKKPLKGKAKTKPAPKEAKAKTAPKKRPSKKVVEAPAEVTTTE